MGGGDNYFWLGASAEEADQALVASDQAAARLAPTGFDPLRKCKWCKTGGQDYAGVCFACINRWNTVGTRA